MNSAGQYRFNDGVRRCAAASVLLELFFAMIPIIWLAKPPFVYANAAMVL
jgi:hypothetical protein